MKAERQAHYTPGPRFFTDDLTGQMMFEFVIDGSNTLGPREATELDKLQYAEAFKAADEPINTTPLIIRPAAPPVELPEHAKLRKEQKKKR